MNVADVIQEIKRLPSTDKGRVLHHFKYLLLQCSTQDLSFKK